MTFEPQLVALVLKLYPGETVELRFEELTKTYWEIPWQSSGQICAFLLQDLIPDLTEAEDIKKRWQEYTEELNKKDLHDPDNHDGVITHLEPDILEVKWALESTTTNKASGGDRIPVELFQILKDDAVKVLHSICQQIGKLSSGHRTGKGQFSFQSQRKAMPKNAQTTTQYCTHLTRQPSNAQNSPSQASAIWEP